MDFLLDPWVSISRHISDRDAERSFAALKYTPSKLNTEKSVSFLVCFMAVLHEPTKQKSLIASVKLFPYVNEWRAELHRVVFSALLEIFLWKTDPPNWSSKLFPQCFVLESTTAMIYHIRQRFQAVIDLLSMLSSWCETIFPVWLVCKWNCYFVR